jgi:hypothetical protein
MKKRIPEETVEREIHGHLVTIEIFREKRGLFLGRWFCSSVPFASGLSSTFSKTVDLAIAMNEMNASIGLGFRLTEIERNSQK